VTHKVATPYRPQTSGQVEVSNHEINLYLRKRFVPDRKGWSLRLHKPLWAYRIAFKDPIGMSLYQLFSSKACHLAAELEHHTFWAIKAFNFNMKQAGSNRRLQLNKLDELHNEANENDQIYKTKTKAFHDKMISHKSFEPNQKV